MGYGRYSDEDFKKSAVAYSTRSREEIFTSRSMDESLDPAKIKVREAVDSEANPETTPIILASDVTGSMGMLSEQIIKKDLGTIMKELYDRKPVTDPQIMCAAIGDVNCDTAPLQVTQFEASSDPLVKQLEKIYPCR